MTADADPMAVFAPLRALDVRSLAGPMIGVTVPPGALLVREDQMVGTLFLVVSGQGALWRRGRRIATLGPGSCFGEIDPVPSAPQHYTVMADEPLRVLTFSSFGIERLCAAIPGTRERLRAALPAAPDADPGSSGHGFDEPRPRARFALVP